MMRSNIIILLFAFLLSLNYISLKAQNQNKKMNIEEFEKRKVEYIKKEAGLTKSEADKFFPLNNELTKKKFELRKNHRDRVQKIKDSSDISDAEYKKLLEDDVEVKLKEAALDKEFAKKFEGVLTPEKLYKAQQSEREFLQKEISNFRSIQNRDR